MSLDEYERGMKRGYNSALRILREFDMKAFDLTDKDDIYNVGKSNLYNIQKDLIHEIYGAIKKEKEEYTDDQFS
tara:strand:+ start:648 stop:869 length:222 start_codon:yes stop_codon:yes gene_type:complete